MKTCHLTASDTALYRVDKKYVYSNYLYIRYYILYTYFWPTLYTHVPTIFKVEDGMQRVSQKKKTFDIKHKFKNYRGIQKCRQQVHTKDP